MKKQNVNNKTHCISKTQIGRIILEISKEQTSNNIKWSVNAKKILHDIIETFIEEKFQNAKKLLDITNTKTLNKRHLSVLQNIHL